MRPLGLSLDASCGRRAASVVPETLVPTAGESRGGCLWHRDELFPCSSRGTQILQRLVALTGFEPVFEP